MKLLNPDIDSLCEVCIIKEMNIENIIQKLRDAFFSENIQKNDKHEIEVQLKESLLSFPSLDVHKKIHKILIELYGHKHPFLAEIYESSGDYFFTIDIETSILFYKKSYPIWADLEGDEYECTARLFEKIGKGYLKVELYKEALVFFSRAKLSLKFTIGKTDLRLASLHKLCGISFESLERYPEAIKEYKKSLTIFNTLYTKENESVINICGTISDLYDRVGNKKEAMFFKHRGYEFKEEEDPDDFSTLFKNLDL
jgi:tetratricopeptide (TPR) repeat protein